MTKEFNLNVAEITTSHHHGKSNTDRDVSHMNSRAVMQAIATQLLPEVRLLLPNIEQAKHESKWPVGTHR